MTKKKFVYTLLLSMLLPLLSLAQAESRFNGIALKESLSVVTKKIVKISGTATLVNVEEPSFPLAKNSEKHLVCTLVKTKFGIIEKVVFTFSDDQLCYIEARGNSVNTFLSERKDTARTYMDYDVFQKDNLFLNKKKDIAWIMTQEAMHPNLFAWENPYLDSEKEEKSNVTQKNSIPEFIKMGASIEELRPVLEANSKFTNTQELDGSDPNAQLQIDCFGVDLLRFPRKIEARFGNGKLNVVWILTGKGEEDRIREALITQFGQPIYTNEDWEIYNNWQVGLRKDKPEVLLMEQSIGLQYKTSYFKQ